MKFIVALLSIGAALIVPRASFAADAPDQPPAALPTPSATTVSPDAQHELDAVRDAYAKLNSLQLHGVMTGEMEMAGKKQSQHTEFDCTFLAPNRLRFVDVPAAGNPATTTFGCTGDRTYYLLGSPKASTYWTEAAPQTRAELETATGEIATRIKLTADPGLKLVLASDAAKMLAISASDAGSATRVTKSPDVSLDGRTYHALTISSATISVTVLLDPQTYLLRRMSLTGKSPAPNAMSVSINYDYTTILPNAGRLTPEDFAWTPPAGAKETLTPAEISTALTGHPAPDITLPATDGTSVTISRLKGSVVVLDFWATWCGPCVQSLPHLNQLWEEKRNADLKVYAVDEQESQDVIARFIVKNHYTFPVLMDNATPTDPAHSNGFGPASQAYKVAGIPETVIIGKDGTVKSVLIGFGPDTENALRTAVEAAMTGKERGRS
jgi:peroxiredoxin